MTAERFLSSQLKQLDLPQADQTHVWFYRFDRSADRARSLQALLTREERERAARFVIESARNRFIESRGMLRCLLSGYLTTSPSQINLVIEQLGKPRIEGAPLYFNLAHSGDWLLIGISRSGDNGIDIERHRPVKNWRAISERHFSLRERTEVLATSTDGPPELFFRIWTLKEAILKWIGTGLSTPLSSFDVPFDTKVGAWVKLPTSEKRCWVLPHQAPEGHSAALATSQPCKGIVFREIV